MPPHFTIIVTGRVEYDDGEVDSWAEFDIEMIAEDGVRCTFDSVTGPVQEYGDDLTYLTISDAQNDLPMRIQELLEEWLTS